MDLLNSTLGAIGQVGEGIDKFTGGRAVRGTLAGKPRELLSVLPFSDTAGITDPKDMTSGRDLTDRYGLTDKHSNSWGSSAAGFVADNVLSPANWLGAGAAFRSAPTAIKGLTGAAKALTGADLLDHIAGGAKKLGGFLGGDSAALKIPPAHYAQALPVDVDKMNATAQAANASRPRRYSTDPIKSGWYADDRNARFGRRFGGGPGNTKVPGGIPEFHLSDAIRGFAADESGAAKIPFGAADEADDAKMFGDHGADDNLFGDSVDGEALGNEMFGGAPTHEESLGLHGTIGKLNKSFKNFAADESGALDPQAIHKAGDLLYRTLKGASPNIYHFGNRMGDAANELGANAAQMFGGPNMSDPAIKGIVTDYYDAAQRFAAKLPAESGMRPFGDSINRAAKDQQGVYQHRLIDPLKSHLGFDPSEKLGEPIFDAVEKMYTDASYKNPAASDSNAWAADAAGRIPADKLLRHKVVSDLTTNAPKSLIANTVDLGNQYDRARGFLGLKQHGHHAIMAQLGDGVRTDAKLMDRDLMDSIRGGNPKALQQYLESMTGLEDRTRRYRMENFFSDADWSGKGHDIGNPTRDALERSLSDIDGSDIDLLRESIAPGYIASRTQGAAESAARQFTKGGWGSIKESEARDLATKFFRMPEIPKTTDGVDLADQFGAKIEAGQNAAKEYFSPLYYYINKHLRDLGPENAPKEIDALRSGRAFDPTGSTAPVTPHPSLSVDDALFGEYLNEPAADDWMFGNAPLPDKSFKADPQKVTSFLDNMGLSGEKSAAMHFDGKGMAPISDADLMSHFGNDWTHYKSHFVNVGTQPQVNGPALAGPNTGGGIGGQTPYDPTWGKSFTPDQAKLEAFGAKHGMDPYEMMGNYTSKPYSDEMDAHFGAESPQYKQFFEDKAIADGTATGLDDNNFELNPPGTSQWDGQGPEPGGVLAGLLGMNKPAAPPHFTPDANKLAEYMNKAGHPWTAADPGVLAPGGFYGKLAQKVFGGELENYKGLIGKPLPPQPLGPPPATGLSTIPPDKIAEVRPVIAGLMGLLDHSELPRDMHLWRGVDDKGTPLIERILGARLNSPEAVGREFVDPAFLSAAFDKKTADQFAGLEPGYSRPGSGVTFDFGDVPAGRKASFMNASENEVLFPPGRRIKITDNSGYPNIKATLYGTLLAAIMGRQAMHGGQDNGYPGQ